MSIAGMKSFCSAWVHGLLLKLACFLGRSRREEVPLSKAHRILVIRLDGIGDVAMTTPFLRELRRNCPNAEIALVVAEKFKNLVERCPYVDLVLGLESRTAAGLRKIQLFKAALRLRRRFFPRDGFDWVINPRVGSAVNGELYLSCLSRSASRVIYRSCMTIDMQNEIPGVESCFTHVLDFNSGERHEVWGSLGILERFGLTIEESKLELWTDDADRKNVGKYLSDHRMVVIGCNRAVAKRSWPVERYAEVVKRLKQAHPDLEFVVLGGPQDRALAEELVQLTGDYVKSLAGQMTLRETCAVFERCWLYIGNDSGPMHIGVSMGCAVVEVSCHPSGGDISHVNAPERFGPFGVLCAVCRPVEPTPPCIDNCMAASEAHCILNVSAEEVVEASNELLKKVG